VNTFTPMYPNNIQQSIGMYNNMQQQYLNQGSYYNNVPGSHHYDINALVSRTGGGAAATTTESDVVTKLLKEVSELRKEIQSQRDESNNSNRSSNYSSNQG